MEYNCHRRRLNAAAMAQLAEFCILSLLLSLIGRARLILLHEVENADPPIAFFGLLVRLRRNTDAHTFQLVLPWPKLPSGRMWGNEKEKMGLDPFMKAYGRHYLSKYRAIWQCGPEDAGFIKYRLVLSKQQPPVHPVQLFAV